MAWGSMRSRLGDRRAARVPARAHNIIARGSKNVRPCVSCVL